MSDGRSNLLPNPALAVDEAGWSPIVTSGTGTAARTAVTGMDKPWAYQYTQTAVGTMRIESPRVAAVPGMAYAGTVQCRYTNAAADIALVALIFYNSSGGIVATSAYSLTQSVGGLAANTPMRISTTRVAPAGVVSCSMGVYLFTDATTGTATVAATAARIEQSDDPNLTYADGDTASWSWLGTAGASASRNPAGLDTARLNSVTNPYLAGATTGWRRWVYSGVNSGTIARTAVTGMDRGWAYRLTSSFAHDFALVSSPVAVTPGQWYSATAQARFSIVPTTLAGLVVVWLTSASAYLSESALVEQSSMTANTPYRSVMQVSAPASAAFAAVGFRWTTSTQTPTVDITAARIEQGRDGSFAYADGDTAGWVWDGSTGVSASRSVPEAPVLPGFASSAESATAVTRQHRRSVGIASTELDATAAVGRLRGGALVETLVDTFEDGFLEDQWTSVGSGLTATGRLYVSCAHTAGTPVLSNVRSAIGYAWSGSALLFEAVQMPAVASVDTAFAQMWVMDPSPTDTVDRLGFEYRAAANALDLIGQTGAGYAPIGTTTTLTYSATAHRWLRITHTGSSIVWATSPDGLTWTTQRTLATPPAWAAKTTLWVSFEAYRTTGTNDLFLLDSVNLPPLRIVRPVRGLSSVGRSYSF